jgi:predicted membrane chloride channel (bestrophin family)
LVVKGLMKLVGALTFWVTVHTIDTTSFMCNCICVSDFAFQDTKSDLCSAIGCCNLILCTCICIKGLVHLHRLWYLFLDWSVSML